jgi:hypothetical protein
MTKTRMTDHEAHEALENLDPNDPNVTVRDRGSVDPIRNAVARRADAEQAVDELVIQARHDGITWVEIASALGVSHQAAMQKYRARI